MPANVETMAYVGKEPWHGQGTRVPPTISAIEMIRAAGLDWEVVKRPARGYQPIKKQGKLDKYSRYEIMRMPRGTDLFEEEIMLGMVSERYEPLQNVDAFSFFDPIIDQKTATFETAGALGVGERIWVLAKMPDEIAVVPGDYCGKYLLLSNTHSGQGSVIVKFTAVRVVCQNTLILSLNDGQQTFRVRHSRKMSERLAQVNELILAAHEAYRKAAESFKALANTPVNDQAMLYDYLETLFPTTPEQKEKKTKPPKQEEVKYLFETEPNLQISGVKGTLWAAYNAVTQFEDYRQARGEDGSKRLDRVWFGRGADLKVKALDEALVIAHR